MPKILVTNDDGIHSKGIIALAEALEPLGEVVVVAPASEMSAASHSLTLMRPLRIEQIDERHYAVDGTPTDCVTLALSTFTEVFALLAESSACCTSVCSDAILVSNELCNVWSCD